MTSHTLVITEKPSVATTIATVIGATKKEHGYYIGNNYIVSWCVGHLIQLAKPEIYNQDFKKWTLETVPFIPEADNWQTIISEKTKTQYEIIENLMKRNDVDEYVCATDAGREGELIFRYVYNKVNCNKPFKRLWISSMTDESIRNGFKSLLNGNDKENLYKSAIARAKADWIVGMNSTKAFSILYGNGRTLNIGRVQTPTVDLIVKRQKEIENFKPQSIYTLTADCSESLKNATLKVDNEKIANDIKHLCNGKTATISKIEKNDKSENAEKLFNLTALQQESNVLLGFTAQETLDITQSLYEKKLLTYPRTDSQYLTNDMVECTKNLIDNIISTNLIDEKTKEYYSLDKINIQSVINDNKVSDHHAIIPTTNILSCDFELLPQSEQKILIIILYRLLSSVYTSYKYSHIKIYIDIEGYKFIITDNITIDKGYKIIYDNLLSFINLKKKKTSGEQQINLENLKVNDTFEHIEVSIKISMTTPPKPYTEATLLFDMEHVGKLINDEELKSTQKNIGLGTPATRASIIEHIIAIGYVIRKNKQLLPTELAYTVMKLLPNKLKEADLTAEWEKQLDMISLGQLDSSIFIKDISDFINEIINYSKNNINVDAKEKINNISSKEVIGKCPNCGNNIYESDKNYYCSNYKSNCKFSIWKNNSWFNNRKKQLTKSNVKTLLDMGKVKITGLYSEKKNTTYDAFIGINFDGNYVNFKILDFVNKQ